MRLILLSTVLMADDFIEDGAAGEIEDDEVCACCLEGDVFEGNEILFCDKCNVAVHQLCYGIKEVPTDSWYCVLFARIKLFLLSSSSIVIFFLLFFCILGSVMSVNQEETLRALPASFVRIKEERISPQSSQASGCMRFAHLGYLKCIVPTLRRCSHTCLHPLIENAIH